MQSRQVDPPCYPGPPGTAAGAHCSRLLLQHSRVLPEVQVTTTLARGAHLVVISRWMGIIEPVSWV
jgi:hypothetical protein